MKICQICGVEFQPRRATQVLCSIACRAKLKSATRNRKTCVQCGQTFPAQPSSHRLYCSRKCSGLRRRVFHPTPCARCGTLTMRGVKNWRRTGEVYCSGKCYGKSLPVTEKQCQWCGKTFTYQRSRWSTEFCNRSCAERRHCEACGKKLVGWAPGIRGSNRKRFCSIQCGQIAYHAKRPVKISYPVVAFASALRNGQTVACIRCGVNDLRCIVVHHRDRNRKNNISSNLEILCANCHMIEHRPLLIRRTQWLKTAESWAKSIIPIP